MAGKLVLFPSNKPFHFFYLLLFLLFSINGCNWNRNRRDTPPQIDETLLREGDLVFRRGLGIASRFVLAADHDGVYSHIGIVVSDEEGWKVIHAVPGETNREYPEETIKKERLSQFFDPKRALNGAVFRLDTIEEVAAVAALKAEELFQRGLFFDHDYNTDDSTKMYCTELIYFVYKHAGIDISQGKRRSVPAFYYPFILPHDIIRNPSLKPIFQYTNLKK